MYDGSIYDVRRFWYTERKAEIPRDRIWRIGYTCISYETVHTWSNGYIKFWLYICSTWPRFLIHYSWWKVKSILRLHVGWKLADQRWRALLIRAAFDTRCKHRWSKTATRSSSMWRVSEPKYLSQKKYDESLVFDFELNTPWWERVTGRNLA